MAALELLNGSTSNDVVAMVLFVLGILCFALFLYLYTGK